MDLRLLEILGCPDCRGELHCEVQIREEENRVLSGTLKCQKCGCMYPIVRGIPRLVPNESYANSFGFQWNRFKREQIDSLTGLRQSERRFRRETGWAAHSLDGKWLLDVGCGAGRFIDISARSQCDVVGLDISSAVDAAQDNFYNKPNVHFVQANLYQLPFRDSVFDACYCIGVLQHTPDPDRALRALPRVLKPGGRVALTIYERGSLTRFNGKYIVRPLTRRLNKQILFKAICLLMPIVFPLTELLFRIPLLGRGFQFVIPVANYVRNRELSLRQRYRWAILDTFDMLSPQFDQPQREDQVRRALGEAGISAIQRLENPGLNLVGIRGTTR